MGSVEAIPILFRSMRASLIGIEISIVGWRHLGAPGQFWFDFEFHCLHCGGYEINLPDDPTEKSDAKCSACGHRYATYGQIRQLCTMMGQKASKYLT